MMPAAGPHDSQFVYVASAKFSERGEPEYVNLLHLDTRAGRATTVNRPGDARSWLLDNKGEPRLVTAVDKNNSTLWYREPASGAWRTLASFNSYGGGKDAITPVAFAPDGAVRARQVRAVPLRRGDRQARRRAAGLSEGLRLQRQPGDRQRQGARREPAQ